jgi:uncharacterized protein YbjT (DUF2867 family)
MSEITMTKKVLVLGATGQTGIHVVDYALSKGYEVFAFSRNPDSLKKLTSKLTIVKGDAENLADVKKAVSQVDVVISVINNPRASESPWAKVLGQPYMIRDSIKNVVSAMKEQGKKRVIVMSTYGAGESYNDLPWWLRLLVKYSNMKVAFDDHTGQENALKESDLDWTVVRCVRLSNVDELGKLIVSYKNSPRPTALISRKQVAKFLVEHIDNSEYTHKMPVISEI